MDNASVQYDSFSAKRAQAPPFLPNDRENFFHLFRHTPEMFCLLRGPEHVFEFVNEAHVRTLGFDATGLPIRKAQPDSVEVHGILDHVYRSGTTAELHEIPVTVNNRKRFFNLTYAARRSEDGEIIGTMILGVEVTDQVLSREQLSRNEAAFRTLAEAIPQILWTTSADGQLTYHNGQWEEYTGHSMETSCKQRVREEVHPEDHEGMLAAWESARKDGKTFSSEFRLRRKDGVYRWFLGRALPVKNSRAEITQWFGSATDIHDTKKAQIAQGFLDHASRILSSSLDFNETLATVAKLAVEELADWCSVDILNERGQLVPLAVAHKDPSMVQFALEFRRRYPVEMDAPGGSAYVVRTGKPELYTDLPDEVLVNAAKDPEHLEMMRKLKVHSYIIVPLSGRGRHFGTLTLVHSSKDRRYNEEDVSMATEIARRAALAIENARLFTDLKDAIRSRDEFLSVASHELRTPLTPMKIQLQSLARAFDKGRSNQLSPDRIRKMVDISERQLNRLTALVEEMLDVARINAGKLHLQREKTNLSKLVCEVAEGFAQQNFTSATPLKVFAAEAAYAEVDSLRIEQVLTNLLSNAIKYAPGAALELRVSEEDGSICVSLRDQGPGISPEDLSRIFDRFERVNSPNTVGGLGLGLYISRQIVEAHGGRIWVRSEKGKGATFYFSLPRVEPSS